MAFDHKVHHYDTKGNVKKETTPYTKICRSGLPEIYFDHKRKRFFDPGTMGDATFKIPDDLKERYLGKDSVSDAKVEAAPTDPKDKKKSGRPKGSKNKKKEILVTSEGVVE